MKYKDIIYGGFEINEPVIIDLINSPSLQRLKGIDPAGYTRPYFKNKKPHSRFSHSLGVFLLLRKYGASIEEQISGLIHDVSHSAFSHSIDYVFDEGSQSEQSHQDNIFEDFVKKSDISTILKKHNFDLEFILDDSNFPLKEKNLPDLCADRLDYSLRDGFIYNVLNKKEITYFLCNLVIQDNFWVFKNYESAKKYTLFFYNFNKEYYSGIKSALMFITLANYLKYAWEKKYVKKEDFYTDDSTLLSKIEPYLKKDKKLRLLHEIMNNKVEYKLDEEDYDYKVLCKSRVVDSLFLNDGGEVSRVSSIDRNVKEFLANEAKPKEYFIKFLV